MDIAIIGAPLFYGCDKHGVETAPATLRAMGLAEILVREGHTVADYGDVEVPVIAENEKYACHDTMKYADPIRRVCGDLARKVAQALGRGGFPLVIGGDHSTGIGTLAGVSRALGGDVAVLWIDSHSDIHQAATSHSGNVHGMPLGVAMGLPCGVLNEVFAGTPGMQGRNIFIVGLRSYEPEEMEIMTRMGVHHYSAGDVRRRGVADLFAEIGAILAANGVPALHVSFDIDCLDPAIAPGTGIHVPDGLTEAEALQIVRQAFGTGLVRSMDITELNPMCDRDGMTARLALRIAASIPVP